MEEEKEVKNYLYALLEVFCDLISEVGEALCRIFASLVFFGLFMILVVENTAIGLNDENLHIFIVVLVIVIVWEIASTIAKTLIELII